MRCWCGFLPWLLAIPGPVAAQHDGQKGDAACLVADAFAAEAVWEAFPGFVADMEVERDGKRSHGRVVVERDGRVFVEHLPDGLRDWAMRQLARVIRQRLPRDDADRSWLFLSLPRGRTLPGHVVCRADAPFGPFHWIENRRVQAVEGASAGRRQRLTVLKTLRNLENKYLPSVLVLHLWDAQTGNLESAETVQLCWRRVGGFDLPAALRILSAGQTCPRTAGEAKGGATTGRLVLSGHRLLARSETAVVRR